MPSSPGPTTFNRGPAHRFDYRGISLRPHDALAPGKVAFAQNIRSVEEGTVTVRNGSARISSNSLGAVVHSIFRLNDPTALGGGLQAIRIAGAGNAVFTAPVPADPLDTALFSSIDTGYSTDPLSVVVAAPYRSPEPWAYIGDSGRIRKINSASDVREIGAAPPPTAPRASLQAPQTTFLQSIDNPSWVAYGGEAGAVTTIDRLTTTVDAVIYDDGGTDGMCSIALDSMTGVTEGATINVGPSRETVIVQEVIPAVAETTIAAILYDAGVNGLCTIQPDGGFALGQQETATAADIRGRYYGVGQDQSGTAPITITRTVDFPVRGLVMLNGIELVQILSVAVGTDGVLSFRAFTAGTYVAGDGLAGIPCFRAFTNTTVSGGDPADAPAATNAITPVDADTPAYGGIQTAITPDRDWSQTGDRAMQPDDIISFSVRASELGYVEFVRLLLASVAPGTASGDEFVENCYMYEWRRNDLSAAIQQTGGASPTPVSTMAAAQTSAVTQGQIDTFYQQQFGQDPLIVGGGGDAGLALVAPGGDAGAGGEAGGITGRRTDGFVTVGTAPSRQLALGNNQWITLQCRVRDLARIGTDPGQTLSNLNAAAITLQVSGTASAVSISYSDVYLTGGYGPDCGLTNAPYVYRYRYRSTLTGKRSNPSPSMRAGIPARRQAVGLIMTGSADPEIDLIDVFRFGGSLPRWSYVRSEANAVGDVESLDTMADRLIEGGETLDVNLFQPWAIADLPRTGTCRVVGTSVEWLSGDQFNTAWAPDSLIVVNGRATALYGSPTSATRLEVIDNCDAGDPVEFSIPSPTLMAQPLQVLWGGKIGDSWFHFACGNATDPGAVYWTRGNDPDATSDANVLEVSTGTEPLMNGGVYDGVSFVFSSERLFRLEPAFDRPQVFRTVETSCTRGLWNRWAFCVGPDGIYFVGKDGIYRTQLGEAVSLTDDDLRPIFPRDGSGAGEDPVHCLDPVDFTAPMILTWIDQFIYFDYHAVGGAARTLVYEPKYQRWTPDVYQSGVRARQYSPGDAVHENVTGRANGVIYLQEVSALTDDGTAVDWQVSTPWDSGADPRSLKQWGDAVLDWNPRGSVDGIRVEPVITHGRQGLTPTLALGRGDQGRATDIIETPPPSGAATLSQDFGLLLSGVVQTRDTGRPQLFYWESSWIDKDEIIARRATPWEDLGYKGAKFIQGIVLRANTFNVIKSVNVQHDGGATALTLATRHPGETSRTYPLDINGWTPFIAELVRLQGADDVDWVLHDWRWVWEPAPEAATQWETQDTTFDFPGYGSITDAVLAYTATAASVLTIWHGDQAVAYDVPTTDGVYQRVFLRFRAAKGLSYRFRWYCAEPMRVFQRDTSMRATPWGGEGGYRIQAPFGGPSRVVGAEV